MYIAARLLHLTGLQKTINTITRAKMKKKLSVLAVYLAAVTPMAVHAQSTTEVSSQPPGISDYVQCGVYYALIAECMGNLSDRYLKRGTTLLRRGADANLDANLSADEFKQRMVSAQDEMSRRIDKNCDKIDILHDSYRQVCIKVYNHK
jgi:hypothetical protein